MNGVDDWLRQYRKMLHRSAYLCDRRVQKPVNCSLLGLNLSRLCWFDLYFLNMKLCILSWPGNDADDEDRGV